MPEIELLDWTILTIAALVTSIVSAILGMAGGVSLLGVMTALLPPAAVVPLHGAVQLCSNFTRTLVFLKSVRWPLFAIYSLPLVAGVGVAMLIWNGDKLAWFRPGIGAFILVFLLWRRKKPKLRQLPLWTFAPLGFISGLLTIFVGATGPFIAPFFLRDDMRKEEVVATKAVCQTWGHVLKLPAFLALGFDYSPFAWGLLALMVAVVAGTILGKSLLGKIAKATFVRLFEAVLAVLAVYLIVAGVRTWISG